jgi:hypothetical protein
MPIATGSLLTGDHGNRACRLRHGHGGRTRERHDQSRLEPHQLLGERLQAIELAAPIAHFEAHSLVLIPSELAHLPHEHLIRGRAPFRAAVNQDGNEPHIVSIRCGHRQRDAREQQGGGRHGSQDRAHRGHSTRKSSRTIAEHRERVWCIDASRRGG